MKNLVTDRPSPITVKLAQKSDKDSVFKLMDANVTRGQMKNLVTDRPSPITVKLAQKSDKDSCSSSWTPTFLEANSRTSSPTGPHQLPLSLPRSLTRTPSSSLWMLMLPEVK